MSTIIFDYVQWDSETDKLPFTPNTALAEMALEGQLELGDMPYTRRHVPDKLIANTEANVIAVLAGSLEFIRSRSYTAEQVQSKIRAYLRDNKDRRDEQALREKLVVKAVNLISNPSDRTVEDTIVVTI